MKKQNRILALALVVLLLLVPLSSLSESFYGVAYCGFEWTKWYDLPYQEGIDALEALGAQSIRLWIHCDHILDGPDTPSLERLELMRNIITGTQDKGITIVGMNHHWFEGGDDMMSVPYRNLNEGSEYLNFLETYRLTWETMARALPEITIWEIGNEWNNEVFLHPSDGTAFTVTERARIATDMLYYASLGIHAGNPDAQTMLGGLVDVMDTGYGNAKGFLRKLYQNMKSGDYPTTDPDAFFQLACWHPYLTNKPTDKWVAHNQAIYDVIVENEGHDKPVYFTEIGYSDYGAEIADEQQAEYLTQAMTLIREQMPYVQTVHWFRLFNDVKAYGWGGDKEANFGLYTDPVFEDFAPKHKAYAFQALTGSTADLQQFIK